MEFARSVAGALGAQVSTSREIIGLGEVNHVVVINEEWVVRFPRDPLDTDDFAKEEWCLRAAREAGVSVPTAYARGRRENRNYLVQEFIPGDHADHFRTSELWKTLGGYCRLISEIALSPDTPDDLFPRFGRDLASNWQQHVAYNVDQLRPDDPLISFGVYRADQLDLLRRTFGELADKVTSFGITHGDLVPKNVLLPPGRPPVVIDWGSATTGPSPYEDFVRIWADGATESFQRDDLASFADGYGCAIDPLLETMHGIWLLGQIDVVRWAMDCRPDRIDVLSANARAATERL